MTLCYCRSLENRNNNNSHGMGREMEGRFKREGYMYTYGSFMLRFDRKQHNSVKQLSFN